MNWLPTATPPTSPTSINGIAPEITLKSILKGSIPYVLCMVLAIVILCLFPGLATWLPAAVMGTAL